MFGAAIVLAALAVLAVLTIGPARGGFASAARELAASLGLISQQEVIVEVKDMAFPPVIRVKPGTKVTWVNRDAMKHSVIADDEGFRTGLFGKGESVSVTFGRVGDFPYYCGPHPFMRGTVIVDDAQK